jgi:hypothetical protein
MQLPFFYTDQIAEAGASLTLNEETKHIDARMTKGEAQAQCWMAKECCLLLKLSMIIRNAASYHQNCEPSAGPQPWLRYNFLIEKCRRALNGS